MDEPTGMQVLAPLHAQLDAAYPETLRLVAEWLFVQAAEDEDIADNAPVSPQRLAALALLALRQTERLSAELGGSAIYLAKAVSYHATVRDREMYALYKSGRTVQELAHRYRLSVMRVRQICNALLTEERGLRQGKLELV